MEKPQSITPGLDSVTLISGLDRSLPLHLGNALQEAREYIECYNWVASIKSEYLGAEIEGVLYIFLFEIDPARPEVDDWVWVVIGDIPPAYITCENSKNPYEALDAYVGAMEGWVNAAQTGRSVADLIPVNVPATPENAAMLDRRLKFIDERILPTLK